MRTPARSPSAQNLGGGVEGAAVPPVGLASAGVPHTLQALQIQGGTQQRHSSALGPSRPWGGPCCAPLKLRNTGRGGSLALRPNHRSAHRPQPRRASECVRNPRAHSKPRPPLPRGVQTGPEGAVFSPEAHGGWRDRQPSHKGDKQEQRRPQGERPREALAARPSETIFKREESLSQDASGTPPPAQMPVLCIVMCLLKKDP